MKLEQFNENANVLFSVITKSEVCSIKNIILLDVVEKMTKSFQCLYYQ